MRKRKYFAIFTLIFIVLLSFSLSACKTDDVPEVNDNVLAETTDDEYTLELKGLIDDQGNVLADVLITKAMIKTLYETNPVEYTEEEPCYASDKRDEDNNLIPHSLKGVYLEDVLSELSDSATIDAYGSMTLSATDNYVTVVTEDVFNSSGRGSKMIIALEYDGISLNTAERSGALRAVFPGQIANTWAKKLKTIEFSTDILLTPSVNQLYFYEYLDQEYRDSYSIVEDVQPEGTANFTYYGFSLGELIDGEILNAQASDKMHVSAWDYNSESETWSEYQAWTKYEVYSVGYLLDQVQREEEGVEDLDRSPVFDGPTFSAGMTVKNVLSASVFNSSIVTLETAFRRYDTNTDGEIWVKDLLLLLRMYDEDDSYIITSLDDTTVEITAEQIFAAKFKFIKDGDEYTFNYDSQSISFKKIEVKI